MSKKAIVLCCAVLAASGGSAADIETTRVESSHPPTCSPRHLEPGAIDALRRESEQWRRDLGYFRQDEKTVYDGYSDVALQQLAGQGDLLAYSVMYDRMIDAGGYSDRSRLKALLTDWAAAGLDEGVNGPRQG